MSIYNSIGDNIIYSNYFRYYLIFTHTHHSFLNAEEEGFEPPVPLGTPVFKTGAFDHSATPPTRSSYTLPSDSKSNNQTKIYSFCRQAFNIESMRLN